MSRMTPDGVIKVYFIPAIQDTAAPTLIEIATGTELTPFITPAGIDTPDEGQEADASDLASARDKTVPSTVSGTPQAELYREGDPAGGGPLGDDAWDALPRLQTGYLLIARFGGSGVGGAIATGDEVEVWPIRVSNRNNVRSARGETYRFQVNFALVADPVYDAIVAAS